MASTTFAVDGDEENLPRLAYLRELAGGGSSLTPFLAGFQETGFQSELQAFVAERAFAFAAVCVDGSHPLEWTQYHREYRELYEAHFERIIACVSMTKAEVLEYFAWLCRLNEQFDDDSEEFYSLLDTLTASEDYEEFLRVMFAEVRKQKAQEEQVQQSSDTVWKRIEIEEVEEIHVTVPPGVSCGQVLSIQYLGLPYRVSVPAGCGPGMSFTTEISLHKNCDHTYVCTHCTSKFDKTTSGAEISKCKRCYERCNRNVIYCGVSCQKADWPQHKLVCGKVVDFEVA